MEALSRLLKDLLAISTAETETAESSPTTRKTIYRVPDEIRGRNMEAYTPIYITIGPYHAGGVVYEKQQKHKLLRLRKLVSRTSPCAAGNGLIQKCHSVLTGIEKECRDSYADSIPEQFCSSEKFVLLMLLDGCSILDLLFEYEDGHTSISTGKTSKLYVLQRDLLLEENQIPFIVLQKLYTVVTSYMPPQQPPRSLVNLALEGLLKLLQSNSVLNPEADLESYKPPNHLLDLMIQTRLPKDPAELKRLTTAAKLSPWKYDHMRTATELERFGIKFKGIEYDWKERFFTSVKFYPGIPGITSGEYKIPTVVIHDSTESLYRNIMALEQCYEGKTYDGLFTSFVLLMNSLIRTPADVDLLRSSKVIVNRMNDNKNVIRFFSNLASDVVANSDRFHYSEVCTEVKQYCERWWNKSRSYVVTNYYDSRWVILNNFLILVLTVAQVCLALVPGRKEK